PCPPRATPSSIRSPPTTRPSTSRRIAASRSRSFPRSTSFPSFRGRDELDRHPDRNAAPRAAKLGPAVVVGGDGVAKMPGHVVKASTRPVRIHPLVAIGPVAEHDRHHARVLGVAGAKPSDRVRMIEIVVLVAKPVPVPSREKGVDEKAVG